MKGDTEAVTTAALEYAIGMLQMARNKAATALLLKRANQPTEALQRDSLGKCLTLVEAVAHYLRAEGLKPEPMNVPETPQPEEPQGL